MSELSWVRPLREKKEGENYFCNGLGWIRLAAEMGCSCTEKATEAQPESRPPSLYCVHIGHHRVMLDWTTSLLSFSVFLGFYMAVLGLNGFHSILFILVGFSVFFSTSRLPFLLFFFRGGGGSPGFDFITGFYGYCVSGSTVFNGFSSF